MTPIELDRFLKVLQVLQRQSSSIYDPTWKHASEAAEKVASEYGGNYFDAAALLSEMPKIAGRLASRIRQWENINVELFLRWHDPVLQVLNACVDGTQWSVVKPVLTDTSLQALQFAIDEVSRRPTDKYNNVDSKLVDELISDVEALLSRIEKADLDPEVRSFVSEQLERVRTGLRRYNLLGTRVLETTFENAIGSLILYRSSQPRNPPEAPGFSSIVFKLLNILATTSGTLQLPEAIRKLID